MAIGPIAAVAKAQRHGLRPRSYARYPATGIETTHAITIKACIPAWAASARINVEAANVTINQGGAGEVEADTISIHQGGIGAASAEDITISMGGIARAQADDIAVRMGAVGMARGAQVSTELGITGLALGQDVSVTQGYARNVLARNVRIRQGGAGTVIAGNVSFEKQSGAVMVLARRIEGDVRTFVDWRGALAAGAAFGAVVGLLMRRKRG